MEIGAVSGSIQESAQEDLAVAVAVDRVALSVAERALFEAVYRAQREPLLRMLRSRLASEEDAADLMQEAYLRLLRYRHCGADSLRFLLFRVAMNLVVSHQRQAAIRKQVSIDDLELVADESPIEDRLSHEQQMLRVVTALQTLPVRCRQMFVLSRVGGLRHREIAERCGISTRMVEHHIARAQMLIRERVGELAA